MSPVQEQALAALVVLGVVGLLVYRLAQWIMEAPVTPDPWGKDVEEAVNSAEAVPVCHHCLTPQRHNGWFCPECGATVGPYCNYMPYIYVFSQGEVLRAGVTEHLRPNLLITLGFVFLSVDMFVFFAPIYWYFLLKNLWRSEEAGAASNLGA